MQNQIPSPTDAELEILHVLWEHAPCTVRFVNEELNKKRPIGYTTTLKTMQLMFQKHMLSRVEKGRSHLYQPMLQQEHTQKRLLERFMDTTFGGSALNLVMQALGNRKADREELAQIKDYLETLERDQ